MKRKAMKMGMISASIGGMLIAQAAYSQDNSAAMPSILLDADAPYLPDFSYAGYNFGGTPLPHIDTVIHIADHGGVPDDGKDDSAALIAAIAAASQHDGPVRVQLGAGRYQLTEILWIESSGIVLAGMGSGDGGTELYMPRPLNQMDDGGASDELRIYLRENDKRARLADQNLDVIFSEWSWNGGFIWTRFPEGRHATYLEEYDRPIEQMAEIGSGLQGARELTVADASALSVGDVLQIYWHNRSGENGPLIDAIYGADRADFPVGERHWALPDRPLVRQPTRIEAINGNRVTIADPLLHDITGELPAYFARWDHISEVGIQDMALVFPPNPYFGHHNETGFNGVYFTGVHNGWISNLRIENADAAVMTDDLSAVTIANVVTQGDHFAHYAVHVGNVHNVLVTGNHVFNATQHTFSFNTQATRSVYHRSIGWEQPTLDQHAGSNHQNLYDDVTVHIRPAPAKDGEPATYDLFRAGGAGYWLPGHGRYNTVWNLNILVDSNAAAGETVKVTELSGGPDARIVGLHGNRPIVLDYSPEPYIELLGSRAIAVPSLYDWQLQQRD